MSYITSIEEEILIGTRISKYTENSKVKYSEGLELLFHILLSIFANFRETCADSHLSLVYSWQENLDQTHSNCQWYSLDIIRLSIYPYWAISWIRDGKLPDTQISKRGKKHKLHWFEDEGNSWKRKQGKSQFSLEQKGFYHYTTIRNHWWNQLTIGN